jgi:hypothetical protein
VAIEQPQPGQQFVLAIRLRKNDAWLMVMTVSQAIRPVELLKTELGRAAYTLGYRDFTLLPLQPPITEAREASSVVLPEVDKAIVVKSELGV